MISYMRVPKSYLLSSIVGSLLILSTQQAMADSYPSFNVQPPVWAAGKAPIAWGDCIPVPINGMRMPSQQFNMTSMMSAPLPPPPLPMMNFPAPLSNGQANVLPPPSPFFNNGMMPPAPLPPMPMAMPSQACNDNSKDELKAFQLKYKQAAAASKSRIEELTQSLSDSKNQMADVQVAMKKITEEKDSDRANGMNALAGLRDQINLLMDKNTTLQEKISLMEADSGKQTEKLAALAKSSTELEKLKLSNESKDEELAKLKKQIGEMDNAGKTLQSQLVAAQGAAGSQARKLTALSQSSKELTALKSAYKARNDEVAALKKQIGEMDSAGKTLQSKLAMAQNSAGAQARKLTALGQSSTELIGLKSAYKALNQQNAELKATLKSTEEFANTCKFEVADLKKKSAGADNNSKSLLAKITGLEGTISSQARQITALKAASVELNSLKSAYKDLSSKKSELTSKLDAATADTDKDGVLDSIDKCPNSPAGDKVNTQGCPDIIDTDGDKVADANDLCPSTQAGEAVNEFGCAQTENITLKGVVFKTGSARLTTSSLPKVAAAAEILNKNPDLKIKIAGYTDNQGGAAINQRLSQRRANAVMIELIRGGVDAERLSAKGYGEENPVASNNTAEGRATNRRVELVIQK